MNAGCTVVNADTLMSPQGDDVIDAGDSMTSLLHTDVISRPWVSSSLDGVCDVMGVNSPGIEGLVEVNRLAGRGTGPVMAGGEPLGQKGSPADGVIPITPLLLLLLLPLVAPQGSPNILLTSITTATIIVRTTS